MNMDPGRVTVEDVRKCATCEKTLTGRARTYCSEWCAKARPCRGCGTAKIGNSVYCADCRRDRTPSVELTHDPEWIERQRTRDQRAKRRPALGPDGLWWCSGCRVWLHPRQFLVLKDFRAGRQAPVACRACRSARGHATRIKSEFGMSADDYAALLVLQGGGCAICGGKPRTERLAVDHDHKTLEVRGLLCSACNRELLDGIRHSARLASRAALYLTAPPARTGVPVANAVSISVDDLNALIAAMDLSRPGARVLMDRLWLDLGAA